jgi:hypothetical protein
MMKIQEKSTPRFFANSNPPMTATAKPSAQLDEETLEGAGVLAGD